MKAMAKNKTGKGVRRLDWGGAGNSAFSNLGQSLIKEAFEQRP